MSTESARVESILTFISNYIRKEGQPPTVREIGKHEGILSTNTVMYWLGRIEAYGYITRKGGIPRGIRFTPAGLERIGLSEIIVR